MVRKTWLEGLDYPTHFIVEMGVGRSHRPPLNMNHYLPPTTTNPPNTHYLSPTTTTQTPTTNKQAPTHHQPTHHNPPNYPQHITHQP